MDESVRHKTDVTEPDNPLYLLSKISNEDLVKLEAEFKKTALVAEIGLSKDNFIEVVKKISGNGEI